MIGRLTHYVLDAALVSTVLAGVKKSTGFAVDTSSISDPTARGIADKFLGVGETVFDMVQATAVNNGYFKRSTPS
ncbi:hypothetical protein BKA70DRAFT_1096906 [Coprinopsis sp. MPI-PUGE-AT-0042]|nr:hypothetical protein BKA70DRAFT_1096906 [Coprinopsis sp. MPI-PUGE-AT-0042]